VTEVKSSAIEISMKLRQSLTSSCFRVKMGLKINLSLKFQCYFRTTCVEVMAVHSLGLRHAVMSSGSGGSGSGSSGSGSGGSGSKL
jgi:hypothetical protein